MGYKDLDHHVNENPDLCFAKQLLAEAYSLLKISYESRYDGVEFYYYKGIFGLPQTKPEIVIFMSSGFIIKITTIGKGKNEKCHMDFFHANNIRNMTFHSIPYKYDYEVKLVLEFGNGNKGSILKLDTSQDCNKYWQEKYAEQVKSIARFIIRQHFQDRTQQTAHGGIKNMNKQVL